LINPGAPFQLPPVCCCCLNPSARVRRVRIGPVAYQQYLVVPVPFCLGCRVRRLLWSTAQWALMLGLAASVTYGVSRLPVEGIWPLCTGMGLFTIACIVSVTRVVKSRLPFSTPAGHVAQCDAIDASGRTLIFGSRAYANRWRQANGRG
jgi:hypothetical protein